MLCCSRTQRIANLQLIKIHNHLEGIRISSKQRVLLEHISITEITQQVIISLMWVFYLYGCQTKQIFIWREKLHIHKFITLDNAMPGFVMREREWGRAEVEAEGLGWYKLQNKHIIIYITVYTHLFQYWFIIQELLKTLYQRNVEDFIWLLNGFKFATSSSLCVIYP